MLIKDRRDEILHLRSVAFYSYGGRKFTRREFLLKHTVSNEMQKIFRKVSWQMANRCVNGFHCNHSFSS